MSSSGEFTSLRSHTFRMGYRSDVDDVVQDFYLPALKSATEYRRAVGFFSSSSLALVAGAVQSFAERGGTIRLIASPRLELDDIADIERGYEVRTVIERAALRALKTVENESVLRGLGFLGQLIARGSLHMKLALVADGQRVGMYHEKIGYFRDQRGDVVAFSGSANETYAGLMLNFESIEVYQSWLAEDSSRVHRAVEHFDALWSNKTSRLQVLDFPEVARDLLEQMAQTWGAEPYSEAHDSSAVGPCGAMEAERFLAPPVGLVRREYQSEAIKAWLAQRGRGILKMATGTGKTKTALFAASHLARVHAQKEEPLVVVVVAPFQHLVDQWAVEVQSFGVQPIEVYESSAKWVPLVEDALAATRLGRRGTVVLIATNSSFGMGKFQDIVGRIDVPLLLIGDEAHNLGSRALRDTLPRNAAYRLGLSATPERWFDDVGTDSLVDYFGAVAFELGLGEAIELGALCKYRYFPRLVQLDEEEMSFYSALSTKIAVLLGARGSDEADPDSPLGSLLRQRAGVLGHAVGKLALLRRDVEDRKEEWFQLVYCAEGYRQGAAGAATDDQPQLRQVVKLLGRDLGVTVNSYTAETPRTDRKALLRRFESGEDLRFLVAMRCLDEGVDIPDARVGYLLASSSNPRQFIQRRGRLLRRAPEKTHADIFDYIAVPRDGLVTGGVEVERRLLQRELARAAEFGRLSANFEETLRVLRPIKSRYGLLDL